MSGDLLSRSISIAEGRRRDDREFRTRTFTIDAFVEKYFTDFELGPKDGRCFLQGALVSTSRSSRNVSTNYILMLDHDSGETMDEIADKITEAGLTAILFNTHSHLSEKSEVGQDALDRFIKKHSLDEDDLVAAAQAYLRQEKGVVDIIVDSVRDVSLEHKEGGVKYVIEHDPMHKVRSLFVLEEPFQFAVPGVSQKDRIDEWKSRYKGFAQKLGVIADDKTCDPARLMYSPRISKHAARHLFEIRVLDGRTLTLDDMPELVTDAVIKREVAGLLDDVKGSDVAAERKTFVTPGLAKFIKVGTSFQPTQWLNNVGEFRGDRGDGKAEFVCPFDDMHSNPGDPNDRGFFTVDAEDDKPWYMGCQHATCSHHTGGDRALYLDQACQIYGVKDAAELLTWCADREAVERGWAHERAPVVVEEAGGVDALIEGLSRNSARDTQLLATIYSAIARAEDGDAAKDQRIRQAARKLGVGVGVVRAGVNTAPAARAGENNDVPEVNNLPREPDDPSLADPIWTHWGYDTLVDCTVARVAVKNNESPYIFSSQDDKTVRLLEKNEIKTVNIRAEVVKTEANWRNVLRTLKVKFVEPNDDHPGGKSAGPPKDILSVLAGGSDVKLPHLNLITTLPVFAPDGTLLTKKGYDAASRTYVNPDAEFREVLPNVTEEEMDAAIAILDDALRDFPFSDFFDGADPHPIRSGEVDADGFELPNLVRGASSRAHFTALFLQPFVRNMIDGPTPAYLIDKSKPGTGAGFLANILGQALYGGPMPPQAVSTATEEFRKAITTTIRAGSPTIFLDNINDKLDSGSLAAALTTGRWQDRLLGTNDLIDIPVTSTWIMSANGGRFTPELMRRIVPIRLDASVPNPAQDRPISYYKHKNFPRYLKERRVDLVWAAHTIIQYWIDRGSPRYEGGVIQSFNEWAEVMGGILHTAGIEGFLDNVPAYLNERVEDEDEVGSLIANHLYVTFGENRFTSSEAATVMTEGDKLDPKFGLVVGYSDTPARVVGSELSKMVGQTFIIGEGRYNIVRKKTHGVSNYRFMKAAT